jgi:putative membrane protein
LNYGKHIMDKEQRITRKKRPLPNRRIVGFRREVTKGSSFNLIVKPAKTSRRLMLLIATSCLFACNSANEHNTGGDSVHYIHDDTVSVDTSLRATNFDDTAFIKSAARYLLEDKEKAELVKRNAHSEDIKEFGMRILNDHAIALQQLENLAIVSGIKLPKAINGQRSEQIKKWTTLKGKAFDHVYMENLVGFHEEMYQAFKQAALSATDGEIRSFAVKNEPVLKKHIEEAKRLKSESSF